MNEVLSVHIAEIEVEHIIMLIKSTFKIKINSLTIHNLLKRNAFVICFMDLITQRKGKWPQFVNPDGNVIGYENSELFFRLINHERKIVILAAKARKNMDK